MQNVNVAAFRNMTDRLTRQVRVDFHACRGADELANWAAILRRTMDEAALNVCTRANVQDIHNRADALSLANAALRRAGL